jgi:RNA polymerase sigma factor (sigma-70 family)
MTAARLRLVSESSPQAHDGALLARVAAGEVAALGALYDRHAAALLRFARRLGARDDTDDVVQAAFLRVMRLAPGFDPEVSSARSWLFAIVVRVVQEHRRALRRWSSAMTALAMQRRATVSHDEPSRTDVERCLGQLSLAKRTVVVLADVEQFSCAEIAGMLEVPVGTVWTRLHHARKELRALMREES